MLATLATLAAEAQQAGRVCRVGFLSPGRAPNDTDLAAFRGRLREPALGLTIPPAVLGRADEVIQ